MNSEHLEHLAAELVKRMYRKLKYGNDKYRPEPERKHPIATNHPFWKTIINEILKPKR